jgi:hypothetical protein
MSNSWFDLSQSNHHPVTAQIVTGRLVTSGRLTSVKTMTMTRRSLHNKISHKFILRLQDRVEYKAATDADIEAKR